MAKHGKSNSASVSANNNSTTSTTPVQENTMNTQANKQIATMSDLFASKKEQAKQEKKAGTLKLNDLKKVMKEKRAKIVEVKDQLILVLKDVKGNPILELQAKQHVELEILAIEEQYKVETEQFNLYNVENAEGFADVVVEKTTKYIAPVTRGLAQGLRGAGETLFGFKRK